MPSMSWNASTLAGVPPDASTRAAARLGYKDCEHERHDELQRARRLHDHDRRRQRHARRAAHERRCADLRSGAA